MAIWKDRWTGKTIGEALREAKDRYGSRTAMVFEKDIVTFDELWDTSGLVARGLLAFGVKKGDMVGIWMAGYVEWPYLYYAAARIGAIMVPVNTRYKAFEVEYVLNKSKAPFLVFRVE